MSGNKSDILELIDQSSRPKVEKIIDLMTMKRPHIDIDREFQRELKSQLMSTSRKKSFSWQAFLSPLSLLATSFLVIMAVWKVWWIPADPVPTPMMESESALSDASLANTSVGVASDNLSTSSVPEEDSLYATRVADTTGSSVAKPSSSQASKEKMSSSPEGPDSSLTASDIDISGDIASISAEMDTIISDSSSRDASTQAPTASHASGISSDSSPILPDYPTTLLVYTKEGVWTEGEKKSRSGSGITSTREKTIKREILLQKFETIGATEVSLEYHIAKKSGDTTSTYLVPALLSKEGKYYLIEGYSE